MAFTVPVENYVRSPYPSLPESKERYIQEELKKLERTLGTVSGALNDLKDVETQEDDLRAGSGFNTEVSLASAATADIGAVGSLYVQITGTTTITSFGTTYSGPRFLRFTGALTLTNSASLVLPGGANIVTAVGDTAIVVPQASGWRVVSYERAVSLPMVGNGPAFSAYQSVAQSIGGSDTLLALNVEEFDTAGAFSTATYRFQPTVPGYYQVNGTGQINGTTGGFYVVIYKNGVAYRYGSYVNVSSASPISTVACVVYLNGADYVDLRAASGTVLNTNPGMQRVSFSGAMLRAA